MLGVALLFSATNLPADPTTNAPSITLAWNAVNNTPVAGYKIYFGSGTRNYTNVVNAGTNLTVSITNFSRGVNYFFAATSVTTNSLESDYSSEVTYKWSIIPAPPGAVGIVTASP